MRKRIIGILLIVVLIASVLSGCLGVNTERDMKQVVATVTYKGNTATVNKLAALEQYTQYVESYVSYYGMTEREVFDYFLNQLAVRKLLVLDAVDRGLCDWDNVNMKIIPDSLTIAQRNEAQDKVNEQLIEVFNEYVEIVTDEYSNGEESGSGSESGTEEDEDEDTRTVRPLPTIEEEEKEYSNSELDVESWMQNFEYANNIERIAFRRLEKLLADQYKDEESLLQAAYEVLVVEELQDMLYGSINVTDDQIYARYLLDRSKTEESYNADSSSYGTSISNNSILYYHPESGYGTVKHILLSFEEASVTDRKAENTHIYFNGDYSKTELDRRKNSKLYSDDAVIAYRTELANNLKVNNYGDFADWWATYDADTMADLIDWRDLEYDVEDLTAVNVSEFANIVANAVNAETSKETKIAKFVDYIFGYNNADESGMFNNENDYVVEPGAGTYKEEFQALCEYLISGTEIPEELTAYCTALTEVGEIGSMGWCVTDYGVHVIMVTNIFDKQVNEDGYYTVSDAAGLKNIIIDYSDGETVYDYIKDYLIEAEKTNVMTSYQNNFISIYGDESIVLNNGVIDAIFA